MTPDIPSSLLDASASPAAPPRLRFPSWLALLLYFLLACVFLWRSSFAGDVFLPADLLKHVAPFNADVSADTLPPWNPLRWDGIAQFYPWRLFAAQSVHDGIIPLWNPYQFCGTPFVANSQSAVLYPGNLLFYLLPVARAFHWSAVLHLTLAGWLTFLFLRHLRLHPVAAFTSGLIYAFSAWQIQWLQLPTFLATSCWLPLVLRQTHVLLTCHRPLSRIPLLALSIGCLLLAGHLQIAFYCLLGVGCFYFGFWILDFGLKPPSDLAEEKRGNHSVLPIQNPKSKIQNFPLFLLALTLGGMLALPQILPALELSRMSHRAGKPTAEGYSAYSEYALPTAGLVTLFLPNFYGNDYEADNGYWGFYVKNVSEDTQIAIRHNAAETANFVGAGALILAILASVRASVDKASDGRKYVLVFGLLALLSLLMALGTPVNRVFYFGVPGFGQSGSPARSLVLWAFSLAVLAGFGLNGLASRLPSKRELQIALGSVAFLLAVALSLAAQRLKAPPQGMTIPALGDVFGRLGMDAARLSIVLVGAICFIGLKRLRDKNAEVPVLGLGALILVELFWAGMPVNPTAKAEAIYPETAGVKFLKEQIGHERIAPVNQAWSLYKSPPVVLPPNAGMAYGLRDVQGYDSLLTRQYKEFANKSAVPDRMGGADSSPPEVGNMVFFKNPYRQTLFSVGAKFLIHNPNVPQQITKSPAETGKPPVYSDAGMRVEEIPDAKSRAALDGGTVEWKDDAPTRITLQVNAPRSNALLRLADQWYPGWTAQIDGTPVPIERDAETGIFRQLTVPQGTHTVTFRYEPTSFRLGVFLACVSLMVCAGGLAAFRSVKE